MLGKLIKYEIKAFGRIMLPLYGIAFAVTLLFSVMIRLSMSGFAKNLIDKFAVIASVLFIAVVIAVMVVMVIMIIQRFYRNLLGTEGYLMFTLPVTTLQNILSKLLTAILWILIGAVVGTVAGLASVAIISNYDEFIRQVREVITTIHGEGNLVTDILRIVVVSLIGMIASITKVYASIAIGHQVSNHRVFGAVLAYIGIGILEVLITSIPGMCNLIGTQLTNGSFQRFFISGILVSLLQIVFYGGVTWYLLDKRLNLE